MIRDIDWNQVKQEFHLAKPFNHVVIDDFFFPEIADTLSSEFPDYDASDINIYKNALENKRTMNHWDKFPPTTYRVFNIFGHDLVKEFRNLIDEENLWFDFGLNGGGWHMHGRSGNNNIHLDYSIHPKLGMQRKLNIIVYLTKDWNPSWGGGLELWSHDENINRPKDLIKIVDNKYNRAIVFDTTQNSWHGLPKFISCPEGIIRKSLAGYYVKTAPSDVDNRGRALFVPREDQKDDPTIAELIRRRSSVETSYKVYHQ